MAENNDDKTIPPHNTELINKWIIDQVLGDKAVSNDDFDFTKAPEGVETIEKLKDHLKTDGKLIVKELESEIEAYNKAGAQLSKSKIEFITELAGELKTEEKAKLLEQLLGNADEKLKSDIGSAEKIESSTLNQTYSNPSEVKAALDKIRAEKEVIFQKIKEESLNLDEVSQLHTENDLLDIEDGALIDKMSGNKSVVDASGKSTSFLKGEIVLEQNQELKEEKGITYLLDKGKELASMSDAEKSDAAKKYLAGKEDFQKYKDELLNKQLTAIEEKIANNKLAIEEIHEKSTSKTVEADAKRIEFLTDANKNWEIKKDQLTELSEVAKGNKYYADANGNSVTDSKDAQWILDTGKDPVSGKIDPSKKESIAFDGDKPLVVKGDQDIKQLEPKKKELLNNASLDKITVKADLTNLSELNKKELTKQVENIGSKLTDKVADLTEKSANIDIKDLDAKAESSKEVTSQPEEKAESKSGAKPQATGKKPGEEGPYKADAKDDANMQLAKTYANMGVKLSSVPTVLIKNLVENAPKNFAKLVEAVKSIADIAGHIQKVTDKINNLAKTIEDAPEKIDKAIKGVETAVNKVIESVNNAPAELKSNFIDKPAAQIDGLNKALSSLKDAVKNLFEGKKEEQEKKVEQEVGNKPEEPKPDAPKTDTANQPPPPAPPQQPPVENKELDKPEPVQKEEPKPVGNSNVQPKEELVDNDAKKQAEQQAEQQKQAQAEQQKKVEQQKVEQQQQQQQQQQQSKPEGQPQPKLDGQPKPEASNQANFGPLSNTPKGDVEEKATSGLNDLSQKTGESAVKEGGETLDKAKDLTKDGAELTKEGASTLGKAL